ncbi:unnamed protein product, partial [Prorocentrum cordatum]
EITHTTVRTGSLGAAAGERVARAGGLAHRKKGRWKHACCLYEDEDKLEDEEEEEEEEEIEARGGRRGARGSFLPPEWAAAAGRLSFWQAGARAAGLGRLHAATDRHVGQLSHQSQPRTIGGGGERREADEEDRRRRRGRRTERGGTKGDASSSAARSALVKRPSFKTKRGSRRRAPGPRQRGRAVRRAPAARSSLCSAQRPAEAQHWEEAPRQLQAGATGR